MAEVTLTIGDRDYRIACADGQEAQVRALGALLAERWEPARRASGGGSTERTMLYVALMLADALDEARGGTGADSAPNGHAALVAQIADRLEALAAALEEDAASA